MFNSDAARIRNTQIMQNTIEGRRKRSLVVQYNNQIEYLGIDGTVAETGLHSINNSKMETLCGSNEMLQLNMVRGLSSKVFYAKEVGKQHKICMVNHGNNIDELENRDVFQLNSGKIIAFEPDPENAVTRDYDETGKTITPQSFYILNDQQLIVHVKSNDEVRFRVIRNIDLSKFELGQMFKALESKPWRQIAIHDESVTFPDQSFFVFNTDTKGKFSVPNKYAFVEDREFGTKSYNTDGYQIVQCSAEVDHGHVLQVL